MVLVAVGQMCSTSSMGGNLTQVQILVVKAVAAGAKVLFLPEASDYIGSSPQETISLARKPSESLYVLGLQKEARENGICICAGIHEPADPEIGQQSRKIKNCSIWIDETGKLAYRYQKLHMFDIDIKGGPSARESDIFEAGNVIEKPCETPIGLVGLQICFDLRFPEPALSLKRQGAQIITYPSAFTVPTGRVHWSLLLRARAVETESYIIAAAQAGQHNEKRVSYGHSMIVNAWGEVLVELGTEFSGPEIGVADVDLGSVDLVRGQVPLKRRTDVYPEL